MATVENGMLVNLFFPFLARALSFYSEASIIKQVEGSDLKAYILVNTEPNTLWNIAEAALRIPSVKTAEAVAGQIDVVMLVELPKMDDLGSMIAKIRELKGVQRTQTLLVIPAPVT
jgi:DNA-binding Lrp family transcriptional regulator